MIDYQYEVDKKLTTKQICQIEDFAAQAANDEGFLNSFVFERALMVFAAQVLYEDKREQIADAIGGGYDICMAFDMLVKDGTISKLINEYPEDVQQLSRIGATWFNEVQTFEHSPRGILNSISTMSGDIVQAAAQQLKETASDDVKFIEDFAKKWGLDRELAAEEMKTK